MLDTNSEIIDFYPDEFVVDTKNKKFAWMGEVLLPFIEEERLIKAITKYESLLSEDEQERNKRGNTLLFISKQHKFNETLSRKLIEEKESSSVSHGRMSISYEEFQLGGFLIDINNFKNTSNNGNGYSCFIYMNPPNKVCYNMSEFIKNN